MSKMLSLADLQPGDVLLYSGTGFIARAIQFFDGSEWSHVSLYLGNEEVGEAVAEGVLRHKVAASIAGSVRLDVRRLKDAPADMSPVLATADRILSEGQRYGFEQLLLLAFLCLTRKLKLTPALRPLVRSVLDGAAVILADYLKADKQPMICSEFVYRCFDEAIPELEDPFTLRIAEPLALDARGMPAARPRTTPGPRGQGIHPESLLALLGSSSGRAWVESPREAMGPARAAARPADPAKLDDLIEQYLDEVGRESQPKAAIRTKGTSLEELSQAVDRFGAAWYAASRPAQAPRREALASPVALDTILRHLFRSAADFVTPRDLSITQSLFLCGMLK